MTSVNWQELRQRMQAAQRAAEPLSVDASAEVQRRLKTRARALATEPADEPARLLDILSFRLTHESYAVEMSYVGAVYPLANLTRLPGTPAFVLGIMNVRGEIISVIDIRKFFAIPEEGLTRLNSVIVLQSESMVVGILADSLLGIRRIPVSDIQPALTIATGIKAEYLAGLTPDRTVLLDAARLLCDATIIVQER